MNRGFFTIALTLGVGALVGLQTANAGLIQKDSANFSWKYEMGVDPSADNQNGVAGADFDFYDLTTSPVGRVFNGTINGDGTMTMPIGAGSGVQGIQIESDTGTATHVWDGISYAGGYTVEARLQSVTGSGKTDSISLGGGTAVGATSILLVGDNRTTWALNRGVSGAVQLDTSNNADAMHVFRIAQLPGESTFQVWRDGVQVGTDLACAPGTETLNLPFFILGSWSQTIGGPAVVDYLRVTSGAYAPLPEPSAIVLLSMGAASLLAYAWKKRK